MDNQVLDSTTVSQKTRKLLCDIMADHKKRTVQQMKDELAAHDWVYKNDYGSNHLSGVIHQMIQAHEIKKVARATYVWAARQTLLNEKCVDSDEECIEKEFADENGNKEQTMFVSNFETLSDLRNHLAPYLESLYRELCSTFNATSLNTVSSEKDLETIKALITLKRELADALSNY